VSKKRKGGMGNTLIGVGEIIFGVLLATPADEVAVAGGTAGIGGLLAPIQVPLTLGIGGLLAYDGLKRIGLV
jgi:hypothetical protein